MTLRSPTPSRLRGSPDRKAGFFRARGKDGGATLRSGYRVRGVFNDDVNHLPKEVTPDLIDQSGVLYIPTTNSKTLFFSLIDSSPQMFQPSINQTVTTQLIDQSGVLYAFQIPTDQSVTPNLISQVGVLFIPTVDSQEVDTNLIDQSPVMFQAQINQSVSPNLIDQTGVLYDAAVGVSPELLDYSGVVYDVTITSAFIDVSPGLIDRSGVLFDAAISLASGQTVQVELIDQQGVLFRPSVRLPVKPLISLVGHYQPTIEKVGTHRPTIRKEGIFVS